MMAVRKQCRGKGCRKSSCKHPWWLDVMYQGTRYRMPVNEFALSRGAERPVTSKQEAQKVWEPRFIAEIVAGKDPRRPPIRGRSGELTVAEFLGEYRRRHCEAEKLNMDALGSKLNVLERRFGSFPLTDLEKPGPIEDFKTDLIEGGQGQLDSQPIPGPTQTHDRLGYRPGADEEEPLLSQDLEPQRHPTTQGGEQPVPEGLPGRGTPAPERCRCHEHGAPLACGTEHESAD